MWVFAIFLAAVWIEIILFITIGGAIGIGFTLLFGVASAFLGGSIVRGQGIKMLMSSRFAEHHAHVSQEDITLRILTVFAGIFLIIPGFLTDFFGFALLIPLVRRWIAARINRRINIIQTAQRGFSSSRSDIIDGVDFQDVTPTERPADKSIK